jgi:hypothetical protein
MGREFGLGRRGSVPGSSDESDLASEKSKGRDQGQFQASSEGRATKRAEHGPNGSAYGQDLQLVRKGQSSTCCN